MPFIGGLACVLGIGEHSCWVSVLFTHWVSELADSAQYCGVSVW